jgi:hypothetical protein
MNLFNNIAVTATMALFLSACGGGSSSSDGGTTVVPPNTNSDTVISGVASKGPITGTINIYALTTTGSKSGLLKSGTITKGQYDVNIGKHAGPMLLEVTGSYIDEATGVSKSITANAPLRTALANAANTMKVAVTPLTELAVQKAGALTPSAIDAGNKLVSDIFKFDIINTQPLDPSLPFTTTTEVSQKDYTLTLAALSQLARRDALFSTTLANVAKGISYSGMDIVTVKDFQDAAAAFISDTTKNKTGVSSISATGLTSINGYTTSTYKLAIMGNFSTATKTIKGIQFDVVIPDGVAVRFDPKSIIDPVTGSYDATKGATLPGVVSASTSVIAARPTLTSVFSSSNRVLRFVLYTESNIGAGDLATLTGDLLPGFAVPPATALSIQNISAVGNNASLIDRVSVTVK